MLFLYVLLFSIVTFVFASGGEIPVSEQGAKDTDKVRCTSAHRAAARERGYRTGTCRLLDPDTKSESSR